jgi:hypothetical protein
MTFYPVLSNEDNVKANTVLMRQINPNFFIDEYLSSQAFTPFPKDEGRLSVYDGDIMNAQQSFLHFTETLRFKSVGVWGITNTEVEKTGLTGNPDPLQDFSAHAFVDFRSVSTKEWRKLAKKLRTFAVNRGRLYPPDIIVNNNGKNN